ncbi:TPA: hypothetical protein ACX6RO_001848 [Photobacterium damselae]
MQYTKIRILAECDPIIMDATDFDLLNLLCHNMDESIVTDHQCDQPLSVMVCYGSYKPQQGVTYQQSIKDIAKLVGSELAFIDGCDLHRVKCIDIEIFDENLVYNINKLSIIQKTHDIAFASLLAVPKHLDEILPTIAPTNDALTLFLYKPLEPLINHFLNRAGILAAKTRFLLPKDVQDDDWKTCINEDLVNHVARKTY